MLCHVDMTARGLGIGTWNGTSTTLGAVPKLLPAAARPAIGAIGRRRDLSRGSNVMEEGWESGLCVDGEKTNAVGIVCDVINGELTPNVTCF